VPVRPRLPVTCLYAFVPCTTTSVKFSEAGKALELLHTPAGEPPMTPLTAPESVPRCGVVNVNDPEYEKADPDPNVTQPST
jgi:hypothetical protein